MEKYFIFYNRGATKFFEMFDSKKECDDQKKKLYDSGLSYISTECALPLEQKERVI